MPTTIGGQLIGSGEIGGDLPVIAPGDPRMIGYGTIGYGTIGRDTVFSYNYGTILQQYLPPIYDNSTLMQEMMNAYGGQFDLLYLAINSVINQNFVLTADSWGLTLWEQELGFVTPKDAAYLYPTLPIDQRRARLLQLMRSQVTPTIRSITIAIQSYQDGDVDVWEDVSHYVVYIRFRSLVGLPPNLTDLQAGVRRALPAHLAVIYLFGQLTWNQWDAHSYIWDQVDLLGGITALSWDQHDVWT